MSPYAKLIASSMYECLFKSTAEKYLLVTDTSCSLLSLTRNRQAAAAIFEASEVKTKSSSGSGIVSFRLSVASCLASCQESSSIGPHVNSFFLSRKWRGYSMCFIYGKKDDWC